MRNVKIYRLVNAGRTSPYKALAVDRDLAPSHAWARLVELNNVAADQHVFWALSEEPGEYDGVTINDRFDEVQNNLRLEETRAIRLADTLRNVQMEAVLNVLDCMGVHSTVEFPGYLHVDMPMSGWYWAVGPIQDRNPDPTNYVWTGELHDTREDIDELHVEECTIRGLARKLYCEMNAKYEGVLKK
jgi:hypothetical protein